MKAMLGVVLLSAICAGSPAVAQRIEMDTLLRRDRNAEEVRANLAFDSFAACIYSALMPFRDDRARAAEYRRRFEDMVELQGHIARQVAGRCKEEYQEGLSELQADGGFSQERMRDIEIGINAFAMAITGFVSWQLWEKGGGK